MHCSFSSSLQNNMQTHTAATHDAYSRSPFINPPLSEAPFPNGAANLKRLVCMIRMEKKIEKNTTPEEREKYTWHQST